LIHASQAALQDFFKNAIEFNSHNMHFLELVQVLANMIYYKVDVIKTRIKERVASTSESSGSSNRNLPPGSTDRKRKRGSQNQNGGVGREYTSF
jgi:hypothetical protein